MRYANNDLASLIDTATQALPNLQGRIGHAKQDQLSCGSAENALRIAALCAYWEQAQPEAGHHYWNSHSWSLLIWQPIYLSILAVQLARSAPCLARMGQSVSQGVVGGFCLPEHCPRKGAAQDLIRFASDELLQLIEQQLNEFNSVSAIHPKQGRLLAADCVRAALLMAQRHQSLANTQLCELEGQWMEALQLSAGSALIPVMLDDGQERLALERKVCCQYFRRTEGEYCNTCPKLKKEERLSRLREAFSLEC
ncbi:siderophore ferric iron reductase [Pseudomonas sp. EL_65y_Pfl2_R95]|uniref:siderophore ferric iron reductase n=1 Tax=Pseudomonas sp. EL_65y_Pfl2_R95 TaxID=3088698 RepID=UPI0030DCCEF4